MHRITIKNVSVLEIEDECRPMVAIVINNCGKRTDMPFSKGTTPVSEPLVMFSGWILLSVIICSCQKQGKGHVFDKDARFIDFL